MWFVWYGVLGPLVGFLFGSLFFALICYQTNGIEYALVLASVGIAAAFKLYRVVRTNELLTDDHAA